MKKITLLFATVLAGFGATAQTTLFEDDFEGYDDFIIENIGDYTLVDGDGGPTYGFTGVTFDNSGYTGSFIVFNSLQTDPPLEADPDSDWSANSGERNAVCFASTTPANDDWIITPQISLGASGNALEFFAKATTTAYSNEIFSVGVSTTDTDPGSFTIIGQDLTPTAITYQLFNFMLDDYAGQDVYIGIHCTSNDQFGFAIDDIKVTSEVLGVNDEIFQNFNYFVSEGNLVLSSNNIMQNIELYNIVGQNVVSQKLSNVNETINISSLNAGVYIAKVTVDGATKSFKIIKK